MSPISLLHQRRRSVEPDKGAAPGVSATSSRRRRSLRRAAILLVAAWLVTFALPLAHLQWLLPVVVLVATAGLLRVGDTLLDRLMLALVLLLGVMTAAGFAFTVWPFGFSPAALTGSALTVLVGVSLITGRKMTWPRPQIIDALPVGAALAITAIMAKPYLVSDLAGRLALMIAGEDNARHFAAFDAIARTEGYLYLVRTADAADVPQQMLRYPQGWHLTAAALDRFMPGTHGVAADPANLINHYTLFAVAGFGLFALVGLWTAQWLARPLLTLPRHVLLVATVAGFILMGDLPGLLMWGFPAEAHGLALLGALIAVLASATLKSREATVIVGVLVIGVGLSYYFLLPMAVLATVVWLFRNHAVIRQRLATTLLVALAVAVLAPIAAAVGVMRDKQLSSALTQAGGVERVDRLSFMVLIGLIAAGLLTRRAWRTPTWSSYAWTLSVMLLPAMAIFAYQRLTLGHSSYYFEKALHAAVVAGLAGTGALAILLPPPRPFGSWVSIVRSLGRRLNVVVLTVTLTAALGVIVKGSDYRTAIVSENRARKWFAGVKVDQYRRLASDVLENHETFPERPAVTTILLADDWATTYLLTLYFSALQRSSGKTDGMVYHPYRKELDIGEMPERAQELLATYHGRLRIVATTPKAFLFMEDFFSHHPTISQISMIATPATIARAEPAYGPSRI